MFEGHNAFYVERQDFIQQSGEKDKSRIGELEDAFQFVIVFYHEQAKSYHLLASQAEVDAKTLSRSIQLANRYLEVKKQTAPQEQISVEYFLDWIIESCNFGEKWLKIKQKELETPAKKKLLKNFVTKSVAVDFISFEEINFDIELVKFVSGLITSIPQFQIKGLKFFDSNLDDKLLVKLERAIKHNGFLEELHFEKLKLGDKSFSFFASIWQFLPFLRSFSLKSCSNLVGEIYFSAFLEKLVSDIQLDLLDLSRNHLGEQIITPLVEELFVVKNSGIKELDLSFNNISPRDSWRLYQLYIKSNLQKKMKLKLEPYPIYGPYLMEVLKNETNCTVVLQRARLGVGDKRRELTKAEIRQTAELREEISQAILLQKSIEDIYSLCKKISDLEFDFPPQHVEKLCELLRDYLNMAEANQDFYSFFYVSECAKMIGLSKSEYLNKQSSFKSKSESLGEELSRILNLELPESQINPMLDQLVVQVMTQDLRGPAVDLLLYIKELRDRKVNEFISKGKDSRAIELALLQEEPYFVIEYDNDFADKTSNIEILEPVDVLSLHPRWINYEVVSMLSREDLIKTTRLRAQGGFREYLVKKMKSRALFLLSEPYMQSFKEQKIDKLLLLARCVCRARFYLIRKNIEKVSLEDKLSLILKNKNKIKEIETERIKTDREVEEELQQTERNLTQRELHQEKKELGFEIIGDKMLGVAEQDELARRSRASVQKMEVEIDPERYRLGLVINSFIFRICKLDRKNTKEKFYTELLHFLELARGVHEAAQEQKLIPKSFIVGEILLSLCKFVVKYLGASSHLYITNAIDLLAIFSFYTKPSADIGLYVLNSFKRDIYNFFTMQPRDYSNSISNPVHKSFTFLSNMIDKLSLPVMRGGSGWNPPSVEKIEEVISMDDFEVELEIDIIIAEKKIKKGKWEGRERVCHLVEQLKQEENFFLSPENKKGSFWLFIEINNKNYDDIPLEFSLDLRQVRHLYIWYSSFVPNHQVKLVLKRRVWTVRAKLATDNLSGGSIICLFEDIKRTYLKKEKFRNLITISKAIELAGILAFIHQIKKNEKQVLVTDLIIERFLPEEIRERLSDKEWVHRLEEYLVSKMFLFKQTLLSLMLKFISNFTNFSNFGSSFYQYRVKGPQQVSIIKEGTIALNCFGIYFYENDNFEREIFALNLDQLTDIRQSKKGVSIEYFEGEESVKVSKIVIESRLSQCIVEDIISFMIIGMREINKMFYSYNFIAKIAKEYNSKIPITKYESSFIGLCLEHVEKYKSDDFELEELPFTENYNFKLPERPVIEKNNEEVEYVDQFSIPQKGNSSSNFNQYQQGEQEFLQGKELAQAKKEMIRKSRNLTHRSQLSLKHDESQRDSLKPGAKIIPKLNIERSIDKNLLQRKQVIKGSDSRRPDSNEKSQITKKEKNDSGKNSMKKQLEIRDNLSGRSVSKETVENDRERMKQLSDFKKSIVVTKDNDKKKPVNSLEIKHRDSRKLALRKSVLMNEGEMKLAPELLALHTDKDEDSRGDINKKARVSKFGRSKNLDDEERGEVNTDFKKKNSIEDVKPGKTCLMVSFD